jgi:serine/threonine-protein kinase
MRALVRHASRAREVEIPTKRGHAQTNRDDRRQRRADQLHVALPWGVARPTRIDDDLMSSVTTDDDALAREGTVLNEKWTLVRLLGIGGMGAVYVAKHRNGARAAVKLLHREYSRHAEVRERFRREGYAANKVEHPGVVRVLDDDVVSGGPDAGSAYLVMELLEGESLQERLECGVVIGERDFLEIADGVLDVLRAAHDCGVVHRDLKPENLFFAQEAEGRTRIKVLDFGMARLLDQAAITSYGVALGTPSFMAPEQAAGRLDEIDGRTDLFALATTGFRLLAGRRVHEADNVIELVQMMAKVPAPPIRSIAPNVSAAYARVIDKALQFRREDRYETAAAMQADVRRAMAELSEAPAPPPVPAPAPAPARIEAGSQATIELSARDLLPTAVYGLDESIRIPKRRGALVWFALILCIGIGGALFLRSRMSRSSVDPGVTPSASASNAIVDAGAVSRPTVSASTGRSRSPSPPKRPIPSAR